MQLTFPCPTYIAVRSTKHSGSNALEHLADFRRIRNLHPFKKFLYCDESLNLLCTEDLDALLLDKNAPYEGLSSRTEQKKWTRLMQKVLCCQKRAAFWLAFQLWIQINVNLNKRSGTMKLLSIKKKIISFTKFNFVWIWCV